MDTPIQAQQIVIPPSTSPPGESTLFGMSIRGLIALVLIVTICGLAFFKFDVKEPLYTLSSTVVAYYFGHQAGVGKTK